MATRMIVTVLVVGVTVFCTYLVACAYQQLLDPLTARGMWNRLRPPLVMLSSVSAEPKVRFPAPPADSPIQHKLFLHRNERKVEIRPPGHIMHVVLLINQKDYEALCFREIEPV